METTFFSVCNTSNWVCNNVQLHTQHPEPNSKELIKIGCKWTVHGMKNSEIDHDLHYTHLIYMINSEKLEFLLLDVIWHWIDTRIVVYLGVWVTYSNKA